MLGITLLSEKAEALKEMIKETKDAITQETASIEATKRSNEGIQKSIDNLLTKQSAWRTQHANDLEKIGRAIVELESVDIEAELAKHAELKVYDEKSAKLKSLNKERATLESAIAQAERSVTKYDGELVKLANKTCHACEQELHDHKHEEMTATAQAHLEEARRYYAKVEKDLAKILADISALGELSQRPKTYYDTIEEAFKHQNNLATLESQLNIKAVEVDPYQEQIDELKHTAMQEISWDLVNEFNLIKDHQEFLLKLLTSKDSFIRKKIIDQNLAYLNNRLTYYLDKLGLPHSVTFQNDLTVLILSLIHISEPTRPY